MATFWTQRRQQRLNRDPPRDALVIQLSNVVLFPVSGVQLPPHAGIWTLSRHGRRLDMLFP